MGIQNIQTSKKKIQHNTQPKRPTKPHNIIILRQNRIQIRRNAKSPRKRINTSNKQHSRKLLQNNPTKMSKKNIQNTKRTKKKNTRTTNTMDTQKHTKPKHTTQLPNHIQLKKKQPQIQQQRNYLILTYQYSF